MLDSGGQLVIADKCSWNRPNYYGQTLMKDLYMAENFIEHCYSGLFL